MILGVALLSAWVTYLGMEHSFKKKLKEEKMVSFMVGYQRGKEEAKYYEDVER